MRKEFLIMMIVVTIICGGGCAADILMPEAEKSRTEKKQLAELVVQNDLMREQNLFLQRIAIAIENK